MGLAAAFAAAPAAQANTRGAAAVNTALKLDPDSSLAHGARSFLLVIKMDWAGAAAEARRALQLAPSDGEAKGQLAYTSAILGHSQRAVMLVR